MKYGDWMTLSCFLSHAKLCDVGTSGKLVKVLCNLGVCQIEQQSLIIVFHLFEDFVLHSDAGLSKHADAAAKAGIIVKTKLFEWFLTFETHFKLANAFESWMNELLVRAGSRNITCKLKVQTIYYFSV